MRWMMGLALAVGLVLLAPAKAEARQIRLLDHGLSWGVAGSQLPGASLAGKHGLTLLDDGSGGPGFWALEGCLSIVTEFAAALVVGLVVGVGLVAGSAEAANGNKSAAEGLAGAAVTVALVSGLLIPFATSAIVYALAQSDGQAPSYLKIVCYSIAARLLFSVLTVVTGSQAIGYVGIFAGAIAEVYAANSGPGFFGGGSDVSETRARMITARPEAVGASRVARNETNATTVNFLSLAF